MKPAKPLLPADPAPPAPPAEGGSFTRLPDGSLVRDAAPAPKEA